MYYLRAQLTEGAHVYSFHREWLFAACIYNYITYVNMIHPVRDIVNRIYNTTILSECKASKSIIFFALF